MFYREFKCGTRGARVSSSSYALRHVFLPLHPMHLGIAGVQASPIPDVAFFKECPPSRCSSQGPEIRFPLLLNTSSPFCGAAAPKLYCSGEETIVEVSLPTEFKVTGIDYISQTLTIDVEDLWNQQPPGGLPEMKFTRNQLFPDSCQEYTIVNCSIEIPREAHHGEGFRGPIRRLSVPGFFAYGADPEIYMNRLPSHCSVVSTVFVPPEVLPPRNCYRDSPRISGWKIRASLVRCDDITTEGMEVLPYYDLFRMCGECERYGGCCGINRTANKPFCYPVPPLSKLMQDHPHHKHTPLITGSVLTGVAVTVVALVLIYVIRKSSKAEKTRRKVEQFLANYRSTKPTCYSYSDIKKITKRFKQKLGQGGFGTVYRGELPNGIPVAVKMLDKSMGDGDEFINEVATAGRIHHANVVKLLGFCSEGPRRALIYEFMPNQSLEKMIFSKDEANRRPLTFKKLEEIAIGVAKGIEYLHQGCNERILHFDIKPHNILLGPHLNPKISDFGLAKLCSKDCSRVTMTMARGTMGYIAPEMYSRNFGSVSYKSDVYSFGMLLMEMIIGRKTAEPSLETNSQIHIPEQIYVHLVRDEDFLSVLGIEEDEEIARKLAVVALWCIQWKPDDRPSMTTVVQMLTGSSQNLRVPPTPFVSFGAQGNVAPPTPGNL